jgi:hypothetical protein
MRLDDRRLVPLVAQRVVPARVFGEVRDARQLEPHEVVRVVRDSLRVGFGEANAHVRREREALHRPDSTMES